ncbi:hypothetical protein P606_18710 [Comamonas thiooxydans]|nr:hypothetical protein P606_18710 [Comamonas thiooxydans]
MQARSSENSQFSGLLEVQEISRGSDHGGYLATDQICHTGYRSTVGNVSKLHSRFLAQQGPKQMKWTACSRRAEARMLRIGFGPTHKVTHCFNFIRNHRANCQCVGGQGRDRNRTKVPKRIVIKFVIDEGIKRKRSVRCQQQRIPIWCSSLNRCTRNTPSSAYSVVDDNRFCVTGCHDSVTNTSTNRIYDSASREAVDDL